MFALTASAVIGNARTRAPQALKIALPSAGAITVTAGSPTPVGFLAVGDDVDGDFRHLAHPQGV